MFWPAVWLGVTLLGAKGAYLEPLSARANPSVLAYLAEWVVASASDLLYALVVGCAGQGLLLLSAGWPRVRRVIWYVLMSFCLASVVYAVASVSIFSYLRTSLTYTWLSLATDLRAMRSSLRVFITPGLVAAVLLVPLAYLALVRMTARWLGAPRGRRARSVVSLAAAAVIALAAAARFHVSRSASPERIRLAESPHFVLLCSVVRQGLIGTKPDLSIAFSADYTADFRPAAERPGGTAPTPGLARGPKNVLIVVCESVSTQFLNLYGSEYNVWPRVAEEARHAVVFDHYYAHITNTANSLFPMTLATYPPIRHAEQTVERPNARGTTVAQVLKPLGYRTAFISAGYNDWANQAEFLKGRGYDVVWDGKNAGAPELNSWGVEDRYMVDMVLKFIDQDRGKPFFAFAWTQATHHPYGPEYGMPQEGWENVDFLRGAKKYGVMTWDLGRYLNALHEADKQIARLLGAIRDRGLADDTIVIITGDHGQAFGWPRKGSGHTGRVFEEDLHVPLLVWSPRLFRAPARSPIIGAHVDLSPTVLDLLGLPLPGGWQGRSLFSPGRPPRAYLYGVADEGYLGVRHQHFKYAYNPSSEAEQLYDLRHDPRERTNIAPADPALCQQLRERLAAWVHYQETLWK